MQKDKPKSEPKVPKLKQTVGLFICYYQNGCRCLMFHLEFVLAGFRIRFHYGHPDVFDRIFHITRGGISKASRGINLSEDIFAGSVLFSFATFSNLAKELIRENYKIDGAI